MARLGFAAEKPGNLQVHPGDDRIPEKEQVLREVRFYTDKDIAWYGPDGGPQDWAYESRSLAAMILGKDPLYLMFYAGFTEESFVLPPAPGGKRRCAVDTSRGVWPAGREEPLRTGTASP